MKHYHKNPRVISEKQFNQLREWLIELGDLGGIVHELNTDEIIGGNQRAEALGILNVSPVITETFDPPSTQGTVAIGYFEAGGERFNYRAVRWSPAQCEKANIIANKAGGDWDYDILANQFDTDLLLEWGFSEGELFGGGAIDFEPYTDEEMGGELEDKKSAFMIRVKVGQSEYFDQVLEIITGLADEHEEWGLHVTS